MEKRDDIETSFACIWTDHRDWMRDSSRWLTMVGKTAATNGAKSELLFPSPDFTGRRTDGAMASLQDLIRERAQLGIVLPDWADVVVEEACKDERASRHLSAYLQAWKTMCCSGLCG